MNPVVNEVAAAIITVANQNRLRASIKSLRSATSTMVITSPTEATKSVAVWAHDLDRVLAAAESTLPKTKMIHMWRVEYCYFDPDLHITSTTHEIESVANLRAMNMRDEPHKYLCVRVTGPHPQEVPA